MLRVIQDLTVERVGGIGPRQINTRIVAATNRPLSGLVDRGLFRTDLFYRLSGVEIRVPPLRLRKGDILELTQYFLARHEGRGRLTMTAAAVDALIAYDWPGNVRELERMIEGAIATAESRQIRVDDLPVSLRGGYGEHLVPSSQLGDTMRAWGSRYARLVLEKNAGNKRQACRALDISYHTLNSYLRYRPASARRHPASARAGVAAELNQLVAGSLRRWKRARRGGRAARSCACFGDWGIDMQQKSRRQFVTASLAGLPMLAYSSSAAPAAFAPQGGSSRPGRPPGRSGVGSDDHHASRAGRRRRGQTGVAQGECARDRSHPGHSGRAHRPALRSRSCSARLRRRQARVGRAALIDEMVTVGARP